MTVASIIGFVPAVFLLYILLKRYEGLFNERHVFFIFAGGLVAGMVITVLNMFTDLSILVFVILLPLFEELAKLIILNFPKFKLKHETVYLGAGLGLGIGSMAIVAIAFRFFSEHPETMTNPQTYFDLLMLSFNFSLLNGATGVIIGYGCSKAEEFNYFIKAFFVHAIYNAFFLIYLLSGPVMKYAPLFFATVFAAGMFWYVLRGLLPDAVPPEMKQKRRREMRKRTREGKKK